MDTAELAAKIPTDDVQTPKLERRGSVLRREALERIRQGKGGPSPNEVTSFDRRKTGISSDLRAQRVQKGLAQKNRPDSRHAAEPTGDPACCGLWGFLLLLGNRPAELVLLDIRCYPLV